MRASAQLTVAADPGGRPHRIERMVSAAPVGWRSTPDAVYAIATAASPVADDDVTVGVDVGAGARLRVRSTAATVVWTGAGSRQRVTVTVGEGAELDWQPEPMIATAGCDHHQVTRIDVAAGARLLWTEQMVLGRHGEGCGTLRSTLRVDVDGRPLLRHRLEVGPGAPAWDSAAVLGTAHAVGLVLAGGPGPHPPAASGEGWAVMPLDGPGVLGVAIAGDGRQLASTVHHLLALLAPPAGGAGSEPAGIG